jgi:YD repeat-containing protein
MTYTYAADGTLLSQTDGRDTTTVYTYDNLGRLSSERTGSQEITYQYGTSGNEIMRLKVKTLIGSGNIRYSYDSLGRVINEMHIINRRGVCNTSYTYDKDKLIKVRYPGSVTVYYSYDDNGYKIMTRVNEDTVYYHESYNGLVNRFRFLGQLTTSHTVNSYGYETERSITKGYTTLERFQMTHDVNT